MTNAHVLTILVMLLKEPGLGKDATWMYPSQTPPLLYANVRILLTSLFSYGYVIVWYIPKYIVLFLPILFNLVHWVLALLNSFSSFSSLETLLKLFFLFDLIFHFQFLGLILCFCIFFLPFHLCFHLFVCLHPRSCLFLVYFLLFPCYIFITSLCSITSLFYMGLYNTANNNLVCNNYSW